MPLANELIAKLASIVGAENVLTSKEDLIAYSFDGTAALQQMPGGVAFAKSPTYSNLRIRPKHRSSHAVRERVSAAEACRVRIA
jgi:glycolate oxidase